MANIVCSLKVGGHVVLSISEERPWLEYGDRKVKLHLAGMSDYIGYLTDLGCHVEEPIDLVDTLCNGSESETYGSKVATLVKAIKA